MNIKTQGLSSGYHHDLSVMMHRSQNSLNYGLKSTQERMERQAKRDNQIAFFEQQKENLKSMKADSLDDISRKLELLHGYDDQITAAKEEYNNSQIFHVMDEARERAEKIKEQAEKYAPKTAEERREEMVEEATGVEENEGMLSDMLDELTDIAEEMQEALGEMTETMEEQLSENLSELNADEMQGNMAGAENVMDLSENESVLDKYKRIDIRI